MNKTIERRVLLKYGITLAGASFISCIPYISYASEKDEAFSAWEEIDFAVVGGFAHRIMKTIDENAVVEYLGTESIADSVKNLSSAGKRYLLDVGSAGKSCFLSDSEGALDFGEGVSALFLDGTFEGLPMTYRDLGAILGNTRCDAMADYLEEVVGVIRSLSTRLSKMRRKTLYIACGKIGLSFETFNYYQESFLGLLNCDCANNSLARNIDSDWLDIRVLSDCPIDVFVFRDSCGLDGEEQLLFERIWGDAIEESVALFVPEYAVHWFSNPLISQGLGVLWLASALYPDDFDIELSDYAQRYYSLFEDEQFGYELCVKSDRSR